MKKWNFYTSNEIKPNGWLLRQLDIQARGLAGSLDKIWRDVAESKWIGGDAEGWERVPYWLDGFIPLAYLLESEDMKARAKKYIDAIIAGQNEDGWICPCTSEEREKYDTWGTILITKVLTVYYECSKDERIPTVIYRAMKNYYDLLRDGSIKLFQWGEFRWYEAFIALDFLKSKYGEQWIYDLAKILKAQGASYDSFTELWKTQQEGWRLDTHIVNIVMSLKAEAVSCDMLDEPYTNMAEKHYQLLKKHCGTPTELFIGDECLSSSDPTRGTELCSVVEQMYSYEHLFAYSGDTKWLERLEVIAFNALPATIDDDMWTHQYDQMSNQIACVKFSGSSSHFGTNGKRAHVFGLEPNFGCCTANMGQGWPKLAISAFMHNGSDIINALPIPSTLDCDKAKIELNTSYPFENSFTYTVQAKEDLKLHIRIPSFAEKPEINGKPISSAEAVIEIKAGENKELTLTFETTPYFEERPHGLKAVKYGSLVFSLPISFERRMLEYTQDGVVRKFPYCDYELFPTSQWNYAYTSNELTVVKCQVDGIPFSSTHPPLKIQTKAQKINWGVNKDFDTVANKAPNSCEPIATEEAITLHPYGTAKLRMTEMPKIK